jgi:hypothetical protein
MRSRSSGQRGEPGGGLEVADHLGGGDAQRRLVVLLAGHRVADDHGGAVAVDLLAVVGEHLTRAGDRPLLGLVHRVGDRRWDRQPPRERLPRVVADPPADLRVGLVRRLRVRVVVQRRIPALRVDLADRVATAGDVLPERRRVRCVRQDRAHPDDRDWLHVVPLVLGRPHGRSVLLHPAPRPAGAPDASHASVQDVGDVVGVGEPTRLGRQRPVDPEGRGERLGVVGAVGGDDQRRTLVGDRAGDRPGVDPADRGDAGGVEPPVALGSSVPSAARTARRTSAAAPSVWAISSPSRNSTCWLRVRRPTRAASSSSASARWAIAATSAPIVGCWRGSRRASPPGRGSRRRGS